MFFIGSSQVGVAFVVRDNFKAAKQQISFLLATTLLAACMCYHARGPSQHKVADDNIFPVAPTNALSMLQYILFTWSIDVALISTTNRARVELLGY